MLFRGYDAMDTLDGTCSTRSKKRRDKTRAPSQTIQERETKQGYSAGQPVGTKNVFILVYHSSQRSDKQPILPWLLPASCKKPVNKSPKYELTTEPVDQPRNQTACFWPSASPEFTALPVFLIVARTVS